MFLIYFFIIFVNSYSLSTCQIRLDMNSHAFEDITIINQGARGICYAAAASQMYSYLLKKNNNPNYNNVSELYTAFMYALTKKKNSLDYGQAAYSLKYILENGSCNKDYFYERFIKIKDKGLVLNKVLDFYNKYIFNEDKKINKILTYSEEINKLIEADMYKRMNNFSYERSEYNGIDNENTRTQFYNIQNKINAINYTQELNYYGAHSKITELLKELGIEDAFISSFLKDLDNLINELNNLLNSNKLTEIVNKRPFLLYSSFIATLFKRIEQDREEMFEEDFKKILTEHVLGNICPDEHKIKINNSNLYKVIQVKHLNINEFLCVKKMPLMVSYCAEKKGGICQESHASLIIGRRKNPKSNTYDLLIRNSWGSLTFHYFSTMKTESEGANFWVNELDLYKNLNALTSIEELK